MRPALYPNAHVENCEYDTGCAACRCKVSFRAGCLKYGSARTAAAVEVIEHDTVL